ncbi:MAG: hypothetical protein EXX96DRAFT_477830 [Benjaminiella poitrasii]|nr:MAG: hypothetical protein EXX96DRAFT_477830 [Benjaminiella poitrasii]
MDYVECVTFSLQVGVFFLMQTFWNYLSNTVAKKSFMGSFEFKFYIVWALGSMAMFPILQWVFRNDVNKREGIPQLAYGIEDMNVLISIILFSYASSFIILCSDGLTEEKVINSNKFATDTIIANVNICTVFLWLLLISIFHPRPQYNRTMANTVNSHSESSFRYSNTPKAQTVGNNRCDIDESSRDITENSVSDSKFAMSSMAIEDPYSNQPVMFSMMNISTHVPMYGISSNTNRAVSPHNNRYTDDNSMSEYEQTAMPHKVRRPSWERANKYNMDMSTSSPHPRQSDEQMVRDWLWQSPDRRNA